MSSTERTLADTVIDALQAGHDELAAVAAAFGAEQLQRETAPGEWTVAQVLSHLGSGAVINLATLEAALAGEPTPGGDANQAVWARWDALGPVEQRDEFLAADAALLDRYAGLDAATRASLRVDLGFLPQPVDLATAGRFRLNELALHSWDVRVVDDPTATVQADAVPLLLDQAAMLLGWIAKADGLDGRTADLAVTLLDPAAQLGLHLGDPVTLGDVPAEPDGSLTLPAEAWLRLVTGRLSDAHLPASFALSGVIGLDTLRTVFRGF